MLKRLLDWFMAYFSDRLPAEVRLESDVETMLKALDAKADAVAFSMARAEDAQEKLRLEIDNYDALELQAAQFLADGDEVAAQRLVTLQLQSKKEIESLSADYQALQREAEQNIATYERLKTDVEERRKKLPKLKDDSRAIRDEEEFRRISSRFSLKGAQSSFDEAERQIRMKKLQLQNKQLLEADPHAELDQRIQRTLREKELDAAMQALRRKVGQETVSVKEVDSVSAARKLLEAPRVVLALPSASAKIQRRD